MANQIDVDPEALRAAAASIDEQAAATIATHSWWTGAAESALPGWIGRSEQALEELIARWTSDIAALAARMDDHAESLRISAASFADMDRLHSRLLGD